jgi:phage terminase large subunit
MIKHRNIDSIQGAGEVARKWADWGADAVFIDSTGGFGAGWIDQLQALGRSPIPVAFSGQAHDSERYYNKRAEMYFEAIEWIRRGGALPESPELAAALTQTTYSFQGDRFLLEPKEDVKAKLGYSCDEADAFVLTFAEQVSARQLRRAPQRSAMPADMIHSRK